MEEVNGDVVVEWFYYFILLLCSFGFFLKFCLVFVCFKSTTAKVLGTLRVVPETQSQPAKILVSCPFFGRSIFFLR